MRRVDRFHLAGMLCCALVLVGVLADLAVGGPPKRAKRWYTPGPYAVGCRTFIYVDTSRTDRFTKRARQLVTEIWYPAADEARGKPTVKFSEFFLGQLDEALAAMKKYTEMDVEAIDKRLKTLGVRNAEKRVGQFPLILFSHGNGGVRMQSLFLTEHLASHGYIVVAPDHTGNAAVTCLPEGVVPMNAKSTLLAFEDRPLDLSFLLDEMTKLNADPNSFLYKGLDMNRVGASGHSLGGMTVTVAIRDKRIKAMLPMAGAAPGSLGCTTPVMLMVADQDKTIGEERSKTFLRLFKMWPAEKWLIELKDAGHFTFSEMHRLIPDFGDGSGPGTRFDGSEFVYWDCDEAHQYIKAYGLAFFEAILRDSAAARKLLDSPALHPNIRKEYHEKRPKQTATTQSSESGGEKSP